MAVPHIVRSIVTVRITEAEGESTLMTYELVHAIALAFAAMPLELGEVTS